MTPKYSSLCKSAIILLAAILALGWTAAPERQIPPRIFYTDILSGPASGGETGQGAFVTIYGTGFGDQRGTSSVTFGGQKASQYPIWTNGHITVQIGNTARSGPIVVHRSPQLDSNAVPFTVRGGRISFVSAQGNDRWNGSFLKPWRTLSVAKDSLKPGDIVYIMDGVQQTALDQYDSAFSIQTGGTAERPIAIVAYPGSKATIGSVTGPRIAARTPNIDRSSDHWVLAGLRFVGAQQALDVTASADWRIIGNDFSCPRGFGSAGCVEISESSQIAFLGNTVHDVGQLGTSKQYHAVYFTTDSNHIDVGWNSIAHVHSCRALQFHSSPTDPGTGRNQFDLRVHDNIIHDIACDAINFATVDPSKGTVEAYNNLIYDVGTGPDPEDGSADYACIYVQGGANTGPPGSGIVEIYSNTMYNCGSRKNSDSGAIALSSGSPKQTVLLRNNIIQLGPGVSLLSPNSATAPLRLDTNIYWPSSSADQLDSTLRRGLIARDPLLADPRHQDFSLRDGSPAIDIGVGAKPAYDLRGAPRADSSKADLGAIQHGFAAH